MCMFNLDSRLYFWKKGLVSYIVTEHVSYLLSQSSCYDWSHHARDGGKGVGDS